MFIVQRPELLQRHFFAVLVALGSELPVGQEERTPQRGTADCLGQEFAYTGNVSIDELQERCVLEEAVRQKLRSEKIPLEIFSSGLPR